MLTQLQSLSLEHKNAYTHTQIERALTTWTWCAFNWTCFLCRTHTGSTNSITKDALWPQHICFVVAPPIVVAFLLVSQVFFRIYFLYPSQLGASAIITTVVCSSYLFARSIQKQSNRMRSNDASENRVVCADSVSLLFLDAIARWGLWFVRKPVPRNACANVHIDAVGGCLLVVWAEHVYYNNTERASHCKQHLLRVEPSVLRSCVCVCTHILRKLRLFSAERAECYWPVSGTTTAASLWSTSSLSMAFRN